MTINPCCIPLKTGVRMVTHLSMALALAVGWSSLKLISISSEVSSNLPSTTSRSTVLVEKFPPQNEWYKEEQPPFYNPQTVENQIFQQQQDPYHHFRIPYEYILYYNWHQQQLQQSHNLDNQRQDRQDDTLSSSWPWHHRQSHIQAGGSFPTNSDGRGLGSPISPLSSPPKQAVPPQAVENKSEAKDDEDEHIFRSILRHRKNFKGDPSPPGESSTPGLFRNSEAEREDKAGALAEPPTPSSLLRVPRKEGESDEEGGQLPIDWFPLSPQNEKGVDSSTASIFPGRAEAVTSQLSTTHRQQDAHEMNRRMMMSKLTSNSQRDDTAGYGGSRTASKKRLTDFKEQYAKVLLVCGLLALCTVVFQFLTSFLLLCFVDKGSNAAAQIWTAVNCSVIFSLATCLVLFLCEGLSMAKYSFDETLYLSLITVDSLLAIYFLWVVMAFI